MRILNPFAPTDDQLEVAIQQVHAKLETLDPADDQYPKTVVYLERLYGLRKKTYDPNTLMTVVGSILLGILVLEFERDHLITTKLFQFGKKLL